MATQSEPLSLATPLHDARLNRRVLRVAKSVAATLGSEFFNAEVKHLAAAFRAELAYLAEVAPHPWDGLRVVAISAKRRPAVLLKPELSGTAAGQVMIDGSFLCSKDARLIFP